MEHAPVALNAIKLGTQHWDKIKDPAQKRIDKARGRGPQYDPDTEDLLTMEEKGYVLKRRSDVQSDEEIVETVRHKGQKLPRRPRNNRQSSSVDANSRYRRDSRDNGSDSEGSVPPRSRKARSVGGRSRRGRSSSTSSSSSSELGSSSEEEHEMKKMRRKKWLTAGLASVATIHAASKVYSSIEAHDKRVIAVQQGALSPEDAHKQARSARWQDAAAIGIAALGIKGAISEWKEMTEEHAKHKEMMERHEEMHRKRIEHLKRQKARKLGGYYKGRDGNWYYDGPDRQGSRLGYSPNSQPRSAATWDTYDRLEGPQQNERKMIEGPPARSHSAYDRSRSKSRSRSYYEDDYSDRDRSPVRRRSPSRDRKPASRCNNFASNPLALSLVAAPFLAAGAYKLTKAEVTDDTILKTNPEREEYLQQYKSDQHGEYKDFAQDLAEEVLGKLG